MITDSTPHLLPGLLPASFRGLEFFVPDARTTAGRRVAEYLFPGIDRAAYDDFGLAPAQLTVEGFVVGDDYVAQARALQAAFERAGPGTLVHPWLGAMSVILVEPGEISFSARELRVARFSATFTRFAGGAGAGVLSTVSALIAASSSFAGVVEALAGSASTVVISRARSFAVYSAHKSVVSAWGSAAGGSAELRRQLPAAPTTPEAYAEGLATIRAATLDAVPALSAPPAVSPSAEMRVASGLSAEAGFAIAIAAADALASVPAPAAVDRALLTAAAGSALSAAARLSVAIDFASRSEARDTRGILVGRLDGLRTSLQELSATGFAARASDVVRGAGELRQAVVADINEAIGRLPETLVFNAERPTDAWELANHLYGDDAGAIDPGYRLIISRNRPRHPAQLPAGLIEALR